MQQKPLTTDPQATEKEEFISGDFDDAMNDFLIELGITPGQDEFRVYLRRKNGKGPNDHSHLKTFTNQWPKIDDIGEAYGGGTFSILVNILGKGKTKRVSAGEKYGGGKTFVLDDCWNEIKKQKEDERKRAISPTLPVGPEGNAVTMAQAVTTMVKDLLEVSVSAQKNVTQTPSEMQKVFNQMMEDSLRSTYRMAGAVRRIIMPNLDPAKEILPRQIVPMAAPPAKNPIVGVLSVLIDKYLPVITGGGEGIDVLADSIKELLPAFLPALQQDTAAIQEIFQILADKAGPERAQDLIQKIGFTLQP